MSGSTPGGFGRELFGDPFGGGGPLTVVRARAVAGQVVRVVFNEEPVHRSASGITDALNPRNYLLTVPGGNAVAPIAVGVDPGMIVGPAVAVGNGTAPGAADERGFDVHTDRPLIVGVVYNIAVKGLLPLTGGGLGTPANANFGGIVKLLATSQPPKKTELVDVFNDITGTGAWKVDDSGDLAIQSGLDGFRKRVLRRLMTPKNAFAFLPNYGVGIRLKQPASVPQVAAFKTDAVQQILLEPEAASVDASANIDAFGVFTLSLLIQTKVGAFVSVGVQASPNGGIVIL